ncbi:MAG TPA: hypothetical protein VEB63_07790 [Chitinophagaceae bacterium]|nr:hypothetical protein [Chitinophagaceae bacterium]
MIALRNLEENELLAKLAECTSNYTRMLNEKNKSQEFYECKNLIERITEEISYRKSLETKTKAHGHPAGA